MRDRLGDGAVSEYSGSRIPALGMPRDPRARAERTSHTRIMSKDARERAAVLRSVTYGPTWDSLSPNAQLVRLVLQIGVLKSFGFETMKHPSARVAEHCALPVDAAEQAIEELERAGIVERDRYVVWLVDALAEEPNRSGPMYHIAVCKAFNALPDGVVRHRIGLRYGGYLFEQDPSARPAALPPLGEPLPELPARFAVPLPLAEGHGRRKSDGYASTAASAPQAATGDGDDFAETIQHGLRAKIEVVR